MIFRETSLQNAFVVDVEKISDDRGFFSRVFCANEFAEMGIEQAVMQANLSFSHTKGTLRGLHYQMVPHSEAKFIRCVRGAIFDVIVDMREGSSTYLNHFSIELTAENRRALYIPEMFAHGYQTLEDDTEVIYLVSEFYTPGVERGLHYNDPALSINWPLPAVNVSEKDLSWPHLNI